MPLIADSPLRAVTRQSGVALVLVLWMLVLLTVIANSLVFSSRTELQAAANLASIARAEVLADAGVYMAIHQLSSVFGSQSKAVEAARWRADGLLRRWRYQEADLDVTIIDESGKVDINSAAPPLLRGLFVAAGVDKTTAESLVDAMLDWRDADDVRHIHGAEKEEYAVAGGDYSPANADFEAIDQLRQVLGISASLFSRIEPFITVHSHQAGINTAVAPREVLLAVPGLTPELVDLFVAQRRSLLEQGLPSPLFPQAQGFTSPASTSVFSIQVAVILSDNIRFVRQAVVQLKGSPANPVAVLAWRTPSTGGEEAASGFGIVNSHGQFH